MEYDQEPEFDLGDVELSSSMMQQIKQHAHALKKLQERMQQTEQIYLEAKKQYDEFAKHTLPDIFKMNGVTAIADDEGHIYSCITNTSCSISKSEMSNVIQWLKINGQSSLVKGELRVPYSRQEELREANIPFEAIETVNTNSVKATLLGMLGQKESPAYVKEDGEPLTVSDLPKGLSFFQWDEVVIK